MRSAPPTRPRAELHPATSGTWPKIPTREAALRLRTQRRATHAYAARLSPEPLVSVSWRWCQSRGCTGDNEVESTTLSYGRGERIRTSDLLNPMEPGPRLAACRIASPPGRIASKCRPFSRRISIRIDPTLQKYCKNLAGLWRSEARAIGTAEPGRGQRGSRPRYASHVDRVGVGSTAGFPATAAWARAARGARPWRSRPSRRGPPRSAVAPAPRGLRRHQAPGDPPSASPAP